MSKVLVVGAGLAGSEASYYLAKKGIPVVLMESKKIAPNPAQKTQGFSELVCTNSLKSLKKTTGHGLLKLEMKALGSLVLEKAHEHKVPAGDALAVDREKFSNSITDVLRNHPLIEVIDEVVTDPIMSLEKYGCTHGVIATGPLTCPELETWLTQNLSDDDLYFYDAIAPVVDAQSLDISKLYFKDRHKDTQDYLNVPLNEEQYLELVEEINNAEKVLPKDFEKEKFFEQCLPIDVMAKRGPQTLRFGCMRPIGLPQENEKIPYAVIQLRRENYLGEAYNLVGFQNRLTYKEQLRIFRKLPGFENAKFFHLGSVHRNTFLNARKLLNFDLSCKKFPQLSFAGQITGVEGYTESAMMGLYVADMIAKKINGETPLPWPVETTTGALINFLMTSEKGGPTNINFGLLPPINIRLRGKDAKRRKREMLAERTEESFKTFQLEKNIGESTPSQSL